MVLPKYSVVIPTYNNCNKYLIPCINSIIEYSNINDIELIVSANGCIDNTFDYLSELQQQYPNVKIAWSDLPLGYPKATNAGIKLATTDKIILLNNDTVLLPQSTNQWLDMLERPFKINPNCGIVGDVKIFSEAANHEFAIFFCVMIKREVFDKIGLLNEDYGLGSGEDIEFCIEAEKVGFEVVEVLPKRFNAEQNVWTNEFPIQHFAEGTMHDTSLVQDWNNHFAKNMLRLAKKYNVEWYKQKLSNNYERAIFLKNDIVFPREANRYQWAANNIIGKKILEIGCSTGFGTQFLPADINYTGLDYDRSIIEVATEQHWRDNAKFVHADINNFEFEQYDTIIAFEVIEHLDNGLKVVEKLKQHCKKLLITVPLNEPPGFWGEHHKLHGLNEQYFPGFKFSYINEVGQIKPTPDPINEQNRFNLLIASWSKEQSKEKILCSISTKNRYHSTLPMTVQSIICQTRLPDKLVIFDDNDEPEDLREDPVFRQLFLMLEQKGIEWAVIYGAKKGQHHNHQLANRMGYDWVWRLDDDTFAEPNVLENLCSYITDDVGAVGGSVLTPSFSFPANIAVTGKIANIDTECNPQWINQKNVMEVEHLHCSFLYRAGICDYNLNLSRKAHREETMFSYELHQKGYKLLVVPNTITWHLKMPNGGIRSTNNEICYDFDEAIFQQFLKGNNITVVVLDNGMGDHLVFKKVLADIKNPIVFSCYPDIVPGRSIAEAKELFGNLSSWSVYQKMAEWKWNDSLENAFRKLYNVKL